MKAPAVPLSPHQRLRSRRDLALPASAKPAEFPPVSASPGPTNSTSPGLPDATKWSYDIERNSAGWFNNELQYYGNARVENSRVENGMLVITARREDLSTAGLPDWSGQRYSSARLVTRDKASWTYGFIEVRAKLPCGVGTWPAIWTLSMPPQTGWPDDGEIDIMEHVGFDPGVVHGTVHTGAYNHTRGNQRSATTNVADACNEFHRYQMTWSASRITVASTIATTSSIRTTTRAMPNGRSTARST